MHLCFRFCSELSVCMPSPGVPTTTRQGWQSASVTRSNMAICERHAKQYGEDWWFLTYLGWSHTEAGNVHVGRTVTERAIALRPENANAAHALSHALFEQGDAVTGRTFLSDWLPAHDRASFLHGHLSWHIALTALEAGDLDGALKIYEQHIRPSDSRYPPMIVFTDSASLLWRLSLAGRAGLEPYWREVAVYGDRFFPQAGPHFADLGRSGNGQRGSGNQIGANGIS
jgi:hypothetical protein